MAIIRTILEGLATKLAADQIRALAPWLTKRLIAFAVAQLPASSRERYLEEWESHCSDVPGDLAKIIYAVGLIVASRKMSALLRAGSPEVRPSDAVRRIVDLVAVTLTLGMLVPLFLFISLVIWIKTKGSILRSVPRVGLGGRKFSLYKFRTGTADNSAPVNPLESFLVKTALNELPMLLNLLKGDVSLVGPRPVHPKYAQRMLEMNPTFVTRFQVKPGLTGLAQTQLENHTPAAELGFDLEYIATRSMSLDLKILLRTITFATKEIGRAAKN